MLRAQAEGLRVLKRGDLRLKVLIADFNYPDLDIERRVLGDAGLEVVEAQCRTEGDVIEAGRGVSALLTQFAPITARVMDELPELRRQSEEYAKKVRQAKLLRLAGHDHFSILEELASPGGALTAAVRGLVDGL